MLDFDYISWLKVLNGVELGGGSIRIHNADLQERILRSVLQLSEDDIHEFSHLLEALSQGCPPHGGLALGFDRLMAAMVGAETIRSVQDKYVDKRFTGVLRCRHVHDQGCDCVSKVCKWKRVAHRKPKPR